MKTPLLAIVLLALTGCGTTYTTADALAVGSGAAFGEAGAGGEIVEPGVGGDTSSTGGVLVASGGTSSGGSQETGGAPSTGGIVSSGGVLSTGGVVASGGAQNTGGDGPVCDQYGNCSTGGSVSTGGAQATGGTSTGGSGCTVTESARCDVRLTAAYFFDYFGSNTCGAGAQLLPWYPNAFPAMASVDYYVCEATKHGAATRAWRVKSAYAGPPFYVKGEVSVCTLLTQDPQPGYGGWWLLEPVALSVVAETVCE